MPSVPDLIRCLLLILFGVLTVPCLGQPTHRADDLSTLMTHEASRTPPSESGHAIHFRFSWNPLQTVFRGLLLGYQQVLSPQLSGQCAFHPSCSEFSRRSIETYGLLKGTMLSLDRLTRCNRIGYGNNARTYSLRHQRFYDPVCRYRLSEPHPCPH